MRTRLTATFILLAISASLIGCTGRTRFPSYYTLHVPPAPDPPVAGGTRVSIAVHEFRSPAYLRQGAIVYRPSAEQIGFYNYQRWAIDPREFLTNAIVDRLRASERRVRNRRHPSDGSGERRRGVTRATWIWAPTMCCPCPGIRLRCYRAFGINCAPRKSRTNSGSER